MTQLETPNLQLRAFDVADFGDVHEYARDPEVTQYQSWGPNDEDDTRDFIRRSIEAFTKVDREDIEFAIVERSTSKVIGGCGLHVRRRPFREFEIGWTLSRARWRRGFGTEAASTLIEYAFSELDAHRIYALISVENRASIALAEKLGLIREGHQRSDTLIRGEWCDTLVFARIAP